MGCLLWKYKIKQKNKKIFYICIKIKIEIINTFYFYSRKNYETKGRENSW